MAEQKQATKAPSTAKPKTPRKRTPTKKPLGADKASPLPQAKATPKKETKKVTNIKKDSKTKKLKNFRLRPIDIERLAEITKQVNEVSEYDTIKEVDIIQALLYIGSQQKPDKVLKACIDSKYN